VNNAGGHDARNNDLQPGRVPAGEQDKPVSPPRRREVLELTPPQRPATAGRSPRSWHHLVPKVGSRLALILGLLVGVVCLQRLLAGRAAAALPPDVVQVYGKVPMNSKQWLHLVRVGSRLLVLLDSQQGMQRLAEITDPHEVQTLIGRFQDRSGRTRSLPAEWLQQVNSVGPIER
jgi:flagellar biogenesis protein FliO